MKAKSRIKIESVPVEDKWNKVDVHSFHDFVVAARDLEVDQSFLFPINSAHRLALTVIHHLYEGRRYRVYKTGTTGSFRIGRVK